MLIDPPALPAWEAFLLHHGPSAIRRKGPMADAARQRVDEWPSFEAAHAQERERRWFARLSDEVLHD